MLPSMPILFTRDSQDAFGNKIEPSTSFFSQNLAAKPVINPEPPPVVVQEARDSPKGKKEGKSKKEDEKKKNDDPPESNVKDIENVFVRSYFTRVQSRFSSNHVPTNKFVQFQNILRDFDPNKETPVDLFKKIEELFGDEHRDIVEDFLLFLKPGQAAEVGRFMDRYQLVQITAFIEMLHSTFARKPTVLRKVVRAITTGLNTGNTEEARARVLPHFRSHPRLTQNFRALFPDERPPDSVYEYGTDTLNESFLTNDKGYDVWEFQYENDKKPKLEAKSRLDSMYINGRVFLQHGRMLRLARVTFPYSKEPYRVHARRLAPSHSHLSPPDSDDDTHKNNKKLPPKKPRKQNKSPTKKDVNDNTKKEKDNPLLSPKPKKSQKQKTTKKDDKEKRERKDSKNSTLNKKEEQKQKQLKVETTVSENKSVVKSNNWTRDEDKTMLQVLKGEAGSETVFGRIKELLPHRSPTEIKERFCHVMTLLQQMAVGEVT